MELLLSLTGAGLGFVAVMFWRRRLTGSRRAPVRRALGVLALLVTCIMLPYVVARRTIPEPRRTPAGIQRELFPGVRYERVVRRTPRPLVAHVVRVDLTRPGFRVLVTPGESVAGGELRARTTSQFARDFGVQIAVNGAPWKPWWSNSRWDYYPHPGDPVDVLGLAVSDGRRYSLPTGRNPALCVARDNRVWIGGETRGAYQACSGKSLLLKAGSVASWPHSDDAPHGLHPRTAVATDRSGSHLLLFVVDGRQPGYSEGLTRRELASLVREFGGFDALNLDGGGSSTLVVEGVGGRPRVLNSPIDCNVPGRERPVANHLGLIVGATRVRP